MRDALIVILYLLSGAAMLAVNWLIWFKLFPMMFRDMRKHQWSKLWRR